MKQRKKSSCRLDVYKRQVLLDRAVENQRLRVAVLGNIDDAMRKRVFTGVNVGTLACDSALAKFFKAKPSSSDFVHAASGQPADPDDFTCVNFQIEPLNRAEGNVFKGQKRLLAAAGVIIPCLLYTSLDPANIFSRKAIVDYVRTIQMPAGMQRALNIVRSRLDDVP